MAINQGKPSKSRVQKRTPDQPDERVTFNKGQLDSLSLGGLTLAQLTLEPGWRWSDSLKEVQGTSSCEEPHVIYHISGRLRVRMDDGEEQEFRAGEISLLPAGHDAWVVGNEPVKALEISGAFKDQEFR